VGENYGNLVPVDVILQTDWDENLKMESVRDEHIQLESANTPSVAKAAQRQDTKEGNSAEGELPNDNIDENHHQKQPSRVDGDDDTERESSYSHGAVGESKSNKGEGDSSSENGSSEDDVYSSVEDVDKE
jgi:hypothetical protein